MSIDELAERLANASREVGELRDANHKKLGADGAEYWRLEGKRQGIELAIDYVRAAQR